MLIREDNQSAKCIATNPVFHARTKHIHLKFHFIIVQGNIHVSLEYCPTEDMLRDAFTKRLAAGRFEKMTALLGIVGKHLP